MQIKKLRLTKSRTIGNLDERGKSKFKKIQLTAECDVEEGDSPVDAYVELSHYIDDCLKLELIVSKKE